MAQPIFQDGEVERLEGAIQSLKEAGTQMVAIAQELSIALSKATTSATTPILEDRVYRNRCVDPILEILVDVENFMGVGRLFVP